MLQRSHAKLVTRIYELIITSTSEKFPQRMEQEKDTITIIMQYFNPGLYLGKASPTNKLFSLGPTPLGIGSSPEPSEWHQIVTEEIEFTGYSKALLMLLPCFDAHTRPIFPYGSLIGFIWVPLSVDGHDGWVKSSTELQVRQN